MISIAELHESGQLDEPIRLAIESGQETVLIGLGIVLVPDMLILEMIANGFPDPGTWKIKTESGRTVYVFSTSEDDAA